MTRFSNTARVAVAALALNKGQARALHRQDRAVRQEERDMAGQNGGHITPAEQRVLNQQENGISHEIGH